MLNTLRFQDVPLADELKSLKKELSEQLLQKKELENEIKRLKLQKIQETDDAYEVLSTRYRCFFLHGDVAK
jgi:predicted phage-related endonuclease